MPTVSSSHPVEDTKQRRLTHQTQSPNLYLAVSSHNTSLFHHTRDPQKGSKWSRIDLKEVLFTVHQIYPGRIGWAVDLIIWEALYVLAVLACLIIELRHQPQ